MMVENFLPSLNHNRLYPFWKPIIDLFEWPLKTGFTIVAIAKQNYHIHQGFS